MICENYTEDDGKCKLMLSDRDNPIISFEIISLKITCAFYEAVVRSGKAKGKVQPRCERGRCFFTNNVYATWNDCPYYESKVSEN